MSSVLERITNFLFDIGLKLGIKTCESDSDMLIYLTISTSMTHIGSEDIKL